MTSNEHVDVAVSNGIPPPPFELPFPDNPETITANAMKLNDSTSNPRHKFLFSKLIEHLHQFAMETQLTTEEWMASIEYLTRVGQKCTPDRQEFILLSDVLGLSALVDALNNPVENGGTESSVLGPFYSHETQDLQIGDSIASDEKAGQCMIVEGRILDTSGNPVPDAIIDTWEANSHGLYDMQYPDREHPDLRGRFRSDKGGRYEFRAIVPGHYPVPGDGPVGELLIILGRHNMRPNHLHLMVEAPGYRKLVTSLYPAGDEYLSSDCVFGVKKSLVVKLQEVNDPEEARRRKVPGNAVFKLSFDVVLVKD